MGKAPNIDAEQPCDSEFTRFSVLSRTVPNLSRSWSPVTYKM